MHSLYMIYYESEVNALVRDTRKGGWRWKTTVRSVCTCILSVDGRVLENFHEIFGLDSVDDRSHIPGTESVVDVYHGDIRAAAV